MMLPDRTSVLGIALGLGLGLTLTAPANAHPHVWIESALQVAFDDNNRARAVTVTWHFDELYSQVMAHDVDPNNLQPLVDEAMVNLETWNYFMDVRQDGTRLDTAKATNASARFADDGRLVYSFTVPLATPADPTGAPLQFRSFDPSFYIDITLVEQDPVILEAAPAGCQVEIEEPPPPEEVMLNEMAFMTMDFAPGTEGIGGRMAERVTVACGQS